MQLIIEQITTWVRLMPCLCHSNPISTAGKEVTIVTQTSPIVRGERLAVVGIGIKSRFFI